ncbi:MAG: HEPN domain-containing protein [Candidatus Azobacteroides sp.]|nr:HEPN domain-containing protein [Candidatus Azobacteroides sp.]
MKLYEIEKKVLIDLKIERANETIKEVPYLLEQGFYRTAINRMYYACYYIVTALLMQKNFEARTHKGIIALFSMYFIKTGILSEEVGKLYRSLFELRQTGDYDELKDINREDVVSRLEPAKQFIKTVENVINNSF